MTNLSLDQQKAFQEKIKRGYNDIPFFAKEFLGIVLHEGQTKFCKNSIEKINVLVPANRWGKTVIVGVKHIHKNFYKHGIKIDDAEQLLAARYETCNLSPDSKQAEEVFKVIVEILTSSFAIRRRDGKMRMNECKIEGFLRRAIEKPSMFIEFDNGAVLLIRPTEHDKAKSIAAKMFAYVSYDEGCKSNHLEYEIKSTILPRLGDFDGCLDILSTPDAESPSLIYYRELFWNGGGEDHIKKAGFYSQEGSVLENPYLPEDYVKKMEQQYGSDPLLQQVVYGKFVITGSKVFDDKDILHAIDDKLADYTPYKKDHKYTMGVDTAAGGDYFVICVIDYTNEPCTVARFSRKKGASQSPQLHLQDIIDIFDHYNQGTDCQMIVDSSNEAGLLWQSMIPDRVLPTFYGFGTRKKVEGVPANPTFNPIINTKEQVILSIKKALTKYKGDKDDYGVIRYPRIRDLINELSIYRKRERGKRDDRFHTDSVIGFGLALYQATDGQPPTPDLSTPVYVTW